MTHTDDLRERVALIIEPRLIPGSIGHIRNIGIANDIIAAVYSDIAARAMSETVVEAVARKSGRSHGLVKIVTHQMLREMGITESEAETP